MDKGAKLQKRNKANYFNGPHEANNNNWEESSEGMWVKNDFVPFYLPILSSRGLRPSFLLGWNELLFLLFVRMGGGGTCTVPTSEMSTIVAGGVGTVTVVACF